MSQQFSSEMECRQYHIDLGRGTFALKAKDLQAYVSEQVKAFQDLKLEERAAEAETCAAAERAEIRAAEERIKLAALAAEAEARAAEAAERNASREHQLALARLERGGEGSAGTPARVVEDGGRRLGWSCHPLTPGLKQSMGSWPNLNAWPQHSNYLRNTG